MGDKLDIVIQEIRDLKQVLSDQKELLENLVNLFVKYDQELLLEDDAIREG